MAETGTMTVRRELTPEEKAVQAERRNYAKKLLRDQANIIPASELVLEEYVPVNASEHRASILAKCGDIVLRAAPKLRPGMCAPIMVATGDRVADEMAGRVIWSEAARLQPGGHFASSVVPRPTAVLTDEDDAEGNPVPLLGDDGEPVMELVSWIVLRMSDPSKRPGKGRKTAPPAKTTQAPATTPSTAPAAVGGERTGRRVSGSVK